jgi:dolichol-phosphate mannosyltransferase
VQPLLVLPTYNESMNIEACLRRIRAAQPALAVLVVDDGSPDGTATIAERLAVELGAVDVLHRTQKAGLGEAYRAGFAWGMDHGADVLIEMDADLSHPPEAIGSLLAAIEDGADLAIGSRYVPGGSTPDWGARRRLLSRWGNRYAASLLRLPVADATAGFRAYRDSMLRSIELHTVIAEGFGFQVEMTWKTVLAGGRITEVPITFVERVGGKSKMSARIIIEAFMLVTRWGLRVRTPHRR